MMAYLMKDRCADLFYKVALAADDGLDVLLKQVNHRRPDAGLFDATRAQRHAIIETQQQISASEPQPLHLPWRRAIAHFDWHLFQVLRELLRQFRQRSLDQFAELCLAHLVRQAIIPPSSFSKQRFIMRKLFCLSIIACLTGCGMPSFLVTPVQNTSALQEVDAQPGHPSSGGKVAIIEVEGMLMNARAGGFLQAGENPLSLFAQQLDEAERDSSVKAVVLRVNSPGGTVTTSDCMYEMLVRFRAKTHKPVVASVQEVAASGAYYVSCASDRIVAQPTSVVGSIGVIFETFNLSGTMDKIGAQSIAIKSGKLKDMGSPFKPITPEERAVMQGMVDEYYARFVHVVNEHRTLVGADTQKIATDGRVFSGSRAKELGLVDEIGLLDDAIDTARKMANAPKAKAIMYKRPYGYRGSIYADATVPMPQASNVTKLEDFPVDHCCPAGFYYLWKP